MKYQGQGALRACQNTYPALLFQLRSGLALSRHKDARSRMLL